MVCLKRHRPINGPPFTSIARPTRLESVDFAQVLSAGRALVAHASRRRTGCRGARDRLRISRQAASGLGRGQGDAASPQAPRKVQTLDVEGLPPDLPQELEDLLAAIENGTLPEALARDAALLDALNKLQSIKDPQALAALARAMANAAKLGDQQSMKDLADRAKRDASMTPPSEIKDALDQLAKNLSDQDSEMASAGFEKNDETEPNGGVDLAGTPQSARDASAIAGIGMIAISKQDSGAVGCAAGMGAGGTSGAPNGGGTMPGDRNRTAP